jgi:hypothetical protein
LSSIFGRDNGTRAAVDPQKIFRSSATLTAQPISVFSMAPSDFLDEVAGAAVPAEEQHSQDLARAQSLPR